MSRANAASITELNLSILSAIEQLVFFCEKVSVEIGLPVVDPLRDGVSALVDNI